MLLLPHRTLRLRLAVPAVVFLGLSLCSLSARSGETTGWRTDGTGTYPTAQPPLEWSLTKNIVWRTPMSGPSNSHPVPLGHRIFICCEPCTLLCLHRDDGKVLWQKTSSYKELEIPADVRERLEVELEQTRELTKQQSAINKESDLLRRKLKEDMTPKEEVEKKLQPFRKKIDEIRNEKKKLTLAVLYTQPDTHPDAGYSTPTPVTNGREVYVAFGNGLVACFDLEGNRKWLKLVEHSNAAFAHAGSPVLVGDRLLIHFTDLVALDTKTGAEAWRLKLPTGHGTPLATRIGATDVVLTPKGAMVSVRDGKLLAENLGSCGANSPVLCDGCVYWIQSSCKALRLPAALPERKKIDPMWKANIREGGYWFSSPVVHDGLVYAATDRGLLTVLEADTGKLVYEERLNHGGSTYPSLSLAGNRLYVSSDKGTTVVVQTGREYKELARNKLEPFRSSLVFDGTRVYVRTHKNLYCIGE